MKVRERLETLMWVLCAVAIAVMIMTDPYVSHWIADRLMEISQ